MMKVQERLELQTFAIVINKTELAARGNDENPREVAWEFLLQRVERLTTTTHKPAMVVHDEGESVRKIAWKARRAGSAGSAFGTGHLSRPARLLIDDPVPRDSRQSYFVQLADVSAYAAPGDEAALGLRLAPAPFSASLGLIERTFEPLERLHARLACAQSQKNEESAEGCHLPLKILDSRLEAGPNGELKREVTV
jgi:hypothetical protein